MAQGRTKTGSPQRSCCLALRIEFERRIVLAAQGLVPAEGPRFFTDELRSAAAPVARIGLFHFRNAVIAQHFHEGRVDGAPAHVHAHSPFWDLHVLTHRHDPPVADEQRGVLQFLVPLLVNSGVGERIAPLALVVHPIAREGDLGGEGAEEEGQ